MTEKETTAHLRKHLKDNPALAGRIYRSLLVLMHTRGNITIDDIYEKAHDRLEHDPNVGFGRRWDDDERGEVYALVEKYAARHLTPEEIDAVIISTAKTAIPQTIEQVSAMPNASFTLLAQRMDEYCAEQDGTSNGSAERMSVRVRLIRKLITEELAYIGVARHHFNVRDFPPIMKRTIGPRGGIGKIGGKAAGMVLASKVLRDHFSSRSKPPLYPIRTPETWFLRSDLFQEFIQQNHLMDYYDIKYQSIDRIRNAYPAIREVFTNGNFSSYILIRLRKVLEEIGEHPIIVRSSSLLEDRLGSAFSGKYQSIFLANQGRVDDRLHALVGAIAEVYASTLGPDPVLYRAEKNLLDYDEQMGVMIQKVVGVRHGPFFLPAWAGAAFSRNEWRWTPRIKREDGLIRIVLGLGTRAVDRVGDDYPRMVPLGMPDLRPEATPSDIARYSQHFADVLNLEKNTFQRISIPQLLTDTHLPDLYRIVSILDHGMVQSPATRMIDAPASRLVVTFDGLLTGPFPALMREILTTLENAYNSPLDVEFAFDGESFYVLQCRPQGQRDETGGVVVPANIPLDHQIFSANREIQSAKIENIEYIVYIDPKDYSAIESRTEMVEIGKVVGRLNHRLESKRFILIGPGRWGSNDIRLGVRVQYADIHRTLALIEMARTEGKHTPEVSFGTHFFQDLIEAGIHHMALYPDQENNIFNEEFMRGAPNVLTALLPDAQRFSSTIRVIHVPGTTRGLYLHLYMNAEKDEALAFLDKRK